MNEEMRLLLKLTEENTRYEAALNYLKGISDASIAKDYSGSIDRNIFENAMRIAGMGKMEIDVIAFDNAPEEVAYAGN